MVGALRAAAADPRCKGLVAVLGPRENLGGLAGVQVGGWLLLLKQELVYRSPVARVRAAARDGGRGHRLGPVGSAAADSSFGRAHAASHCGGAPRLSVPHT